MLVETIPFFSCGTQDGLGWNISKGWFLRFMHWDPGNLAIPNELAHTPVSFSL